MFKQYAFKREVVSQHQANRTGSSSRRNVLAHTARSSSQHRFAVPVDLHGWQILLGGDYPSKHRWLKASMALVITSATDTEEPLSASLASWNAQEVPSWHKELRELTAMLTPPDQR